MNANGHHIVVIQSDLSGKHQPTVRQHFNNTPHFMAEKKVVAGKKVTLANNVSVCN